MNEQEQQKHNNNIGTILFLMEEHGIKQEPKVHEETIQIGLFG